MSAEQRQTLDAILRQSAFPAGIDVSELRQRLRELTPAQPLPAGVSVTAGALGGVPTAEITAAGAEPRHVSPPHQPTTRHRLASITRSSAYPGIVNDRSST